MELSDALLERANQLDVMGDMASACSVELAQFHYKEAETCRTMAVDLRADQEKS